MTAYRHADLQAFVTGLLVKAGLEEPLAAAMTGKMLEADLLGASTHGLMFLPVYLDRIAAGHIAKTGSVRVIADRPEAFAWDAQRLPGAWVMERATEAMLQRLENQGAVTATIANGSHIGCLQAYLLPFVEAGHMVTVSATNPGIRSVAPFNGIDPVLTTNPIAWGIPSRGTPVLVDFSTSLTSNSLVAGYAARGEKLPGQWLIDTQGRPTDDAGALKADPPGSILPLGGVDFGYKGFGAGLFVEAASLALSGHGRKVARDMFGQSVFVQACNPAFFAGREAFLDEIDLLVADCKASRPRPGTGGVRLPGERALASRARQMTEGVNIPDAAREKLKPWLEKLGGQWPPPA